MNVTNVNSHLLVSDLNSPTNHLEGALAGRLVVTRADTRDLETWNGFGRMSLRNGLIWEAPFFSIVSPVLNTVAPGTGQQPRDGRGGGVHHHERRDYTDSLEIHSTLMGLHYSGTVDMKQKVNAHVTAQLLRNTWVVGPLISAATWPFSKLFEYKITGTLKDPIKEPLYVIPKILLMPLHPIKRLREFCPPKRKPTRRRREIKIAATSAIRAGRQDAVGIVWRGIAGSCFQRRVVKAAGISRRLGAFVLRLLPWPRFVCVVGFVFRLG